MFIGRTTAAALVALTALPVLTALPSAANAQGKIITMEKHRVHLPSNIFFSWNPNKRLVTVTVSTGCQSGSLRLAQDRLDVKFDRSGRKISIKGGFTRLVGPGDGNRSKHDDCGGEKTRVESFEGVNYGDLAVTHQNEPLWTVRLGTDAVEGQALLQKTRSVHFIGKDRLNRIFKGLKSHTKTMKGKAVAGRVAKNDAPIPRHGPAAARETDFYEGFREMRVAPGLATSGQFIDVLMPFLQGHPDSLEGKQAMELKIWRHGAGYRIDLVKTGYLDDSVYGEHYRGSVIRTSNGGWELLTLAVKDLCARGESADGTCL